MSREQAKAVEKEFFERMKKLQKPMAPDTPRKNKQRAGK